MRREGLSSLGNLVRTSQIDDLNVGRCNLSSEEVMDFCSSVGNYKVKLIIQLCEVMILGTCLNTHMI